MPKLKVRPIPEEDVYRDIVRIPEVYRTDKKGKTIEESKVCRIEGTPRSSYAVLRGYQISSNAEIHMDERTRNRLGVQLDELHDFKFRPAGLWGELDWALNASETGYRVASRLAIIGFILGVLAFIPVLADWAKLLWHLFARIINLRRC
jgi:hypothetical protein